MREPRSPAHPILPPNHLCFLEKRSLWQGYTEESGLDPGSWSLLHSPTLPPLQLEAWNLTPALVRNLILCVSWVGTERGKGWSHEQCVTQSSLPGTPQENPGPAGRIRSLVCPCWHALVSPPAESTGSFLLGGKEGTLPLGCTGRARRTGSHAAHALPGAQSARVQA